MCDGGAQHVGVRPIHRSVDPAHGRHLLEFRGPTCERLQSPCTGVLTQGTAGWHWTCAECLGPCLARAGAHAALHVPSPMSGEQVLQLWPCCCSANHPVSPPALCQPVTVHPLRGGVHGPPGQQHWVLRLLYMWCGQPQTAPCIVTACRDPSPALCYPGADGAAPAQNCTWSTGSSRRELLHAVLGLACSALIVLSLLQVGAEPSPSPWLSYTACPNDFCEHPRNKL